MAFRPYSRPDDPFWRTNAGIPAGLEVLAGFLNPNKGMVVSPSAGHSIPVEGLGIAAGESFTKGALVRKDGGGDATELTLVTETIYGVALEDVTAGASLGVVTDKVIIARAQYTDTQRTNKTIKTRFAIVDVNGTVPTSGHVGTQCAVSLGSGSPTGSIWASGVWDTGVWAVGVWAGAGSGGGWAIDISDTANQDVEVVAVDTVRNEFIVQFLDAVIQS